MKEIKAYGVKLVEERVIVNEFNNFNRASLGNIYIYIGYASLCIEYYIFFTVVYVGLFLVVYVREHLLM